MQHHINPLISLPALSTYSTSAVGLELKSYLLPGNLVILGQRMYAVMEDLLTLPVARAIQHLHQCQKVSWSMPDGTQIVWYPTVAASGTFAGAER